MTHTIDAPQLATLRAAAHRIRHNVLLMGEVQGQGYVAQALGISDILAVLYTRQLKLDPQRPEWEGRDRLLLSIGHYAIALYAALAEVGVLEPGELETYGADQSRLPMSGMASYTPGMEISGGSLGHGLGIAVGMALGLRYQGARGRVYDLLSDGELNEGSTWEAAAAASHHRLAGLTAVVDINHLQADGPTAQVLDSEPVEGRWQAFGWTAKRVDGNDIAALVDGFDALDRASDGRPKVLLCDTLVGAGVDLLEKREKAHFTRIADDEWELCRKQLDERYAQ